MYKLNYKLPAPHITKRTVFVTAGLLVIFGLLAFGAVRSVQSSKVQAQKDKVAAQQRKDEIKGYTDQITQLKKDKTKLQDNVDTSCAYLKSLTLSKATKSLVTVPTNSGCPNPH